MRVVSVCTAIASPIPVASGVDEASFIGSSVSPVSTIASSLTAVGSSDDGCRFASIAPLAAPIIKPASATNAMDFHVAPSSRWARPRQTVAAVN
jgi:hypothetical protein